MRIKLFNDFLGEQKYYNHKGVTFTMGAFTAKNETYDEKEVTRWTEKYNLTPDSTVCWVSLDPKAVRVPHDTQRINDVPESDLTKVEFSEVDGKLIDESDDGHGNYLFVVGK